MSCEGGTKAFAQLQQAPPKEFSRANEGSPVIANTGEAGQRVEVMTSPLPSGYSGSHCIRFEYVEGDAQVPAAAGERAELQPFNASFFDKDEFWITGYFYVDLQDSSHYALIRQFHEDAKVGEAPGVAIGLYVEGTTLFLEPNTGKSWWTGTIEDKQYYQYKTHVIVSETAGKIEHWFSKAGSALVKQAVNEGAGYQNTLNPKTPGVGDEIYEKFGFNRSQAASGTTRIYHAGAKTWTGPVDPDTVVGGEWVEAQRYVKSGGGVWVAA